MPTDRELWLNKELSAAQAQVRALVEALWDTREAIRYTQEYVGDGLLPALEGWSWYEGIKAADAAIAAVAKEEIDAK